MIKNLKYLLVSIFVIGGCSTSSTKKGIRTETADKKGVDTNILFENFIDTSTSVFDTGYTFPRIKIIDSINVYVKLKVVVYSLDSVVAFVTFINDEKNEAVSLYKPVLPDSYLRENTFSVFDSAGNILKFNAPRSDHKYLLGIQSFMPAVIPDMRAENFLELRPDQKLAFKINLSNYFYFKGFVKKGGKYVFVSYSNLMPYSKGQRHLEIEDPQTGRKPIYFVIESRGENSTFERLKVFLNDKLVL